MSTSIRLAQYVHDLRPRDLTSATRHAATRCVLDLLAAAAAGAADPAAMAARTAGQVMFGAGQADIWFAGMRGHPLASVLANSTAASALDLDDGYREARGHPGAAAIPAAWATLARLPAEAVDAEHFLAAVVAGYEIGIRMARGRLAYAPSGAWSPYAAIAAAGKLKGASAETIAQATGIAAQTAPSLPGLAGIMGSDVKEGIGWGSVTGMAALDLAEAGFTGPVHIFDVPELFASQHMLDGLGGAPLIEGTYFKPYACCRHIHAALDAYLALAAEHQLDAAAITAMQVHTYRATFNLANRTRPRTLVEAQYSVPFCLALCAVRGAEALVPMQAHHLADPAVLALAERITVHHDPDIEPLFPARSPAVVKVQRQDQPWLSSPLTDPRGDPARPLSWADLRGKFMTATRDVLPPERQQRILESVDRLGDGDIGPLRAALDSTGE